MAAGPGDRQERVTRSLRLSWKDTRDRVTALADAPGIEILQTARRRERDATAARNDIDPNLTNGPPNVTGMFTDFDARHDRRALLTWRATSGMVHGRRWAMLALTSIEERGRDDERMVDVKVSGDIESLAVCYHIACLVLQEAMRMFHMRRQLPECVG